MASTDLPSIFTINNDIIPYALDSLTESQLDRAILSEHPLWHIHTLCDYTVKRLHYLFTLDTNSPFSDGLAFVFKGDINLGDIKINIDELLKERHCIFIQYAYTDCDYGHTFAFLRLDGQIYKLESSLNDWPQRVKKYSFDETCENIFNLSSSPEIKSFQMKRCSIPSDDLLQQCKNVIMKTTYTDNRRQVLSKILQSTLQSTPQSQP